MFILYMKIVSIDVGIKNLSFCLFNQDTNNNLQVIKWDNINLSEKHELLCGECDKPAKFCKDNQYYCIKHSKKHNYVKPTNELSASFLKKQKLQVLMDIANKYKLTVDPLFKKSQVLDIITEFIEHNCYTEVSKISASKVDLVTIGRNMQHKFDEIFAEHLSSIDIMIIENQIGPLAKKKKTIQGMISQYFIMKNNNIRIEFISAGNKLKDFLPNEKTDYGQRKKLGIQICLDIVSKDVRFKEWEPFVNKYKKKDDLSDCFLQGMWFIKHKCNYI